jgi:translation initiation factor eIF-2B subunit gamma
LVTPPASAPAITTALNLNPHLTALPLPKPDLIAPKDLDQTTGTAQIFRLPEVRAAITGDFIVLPCDLVCELGGESLLETWLIKEAGLGGATGGGDEFTGPKMAVGGERGGRRGGLGVWYSTKGDISVKGEETDFITTSPLASGPVPSPKTSLLPHTSNLVYSVPTDTLNDITEEKKSLPVRHGLLRKHPRIRMLTSHRDAHLYIFPAWVLDMISHNEHMENLSEDVIGWWAKAGWQDGLADKLGLRAIFDGPAGSESEDGNGGNGLLDEDVDIGALSTTWTSNTVTAESRPVEFSGIRGTSQSTSSDQQFGATGSKPQVIVPPILAYVHPSQSAAPLIRRVDTAPLLLLISLQLAKLESIEEVGKAASSPFAHPNKVAYPAGIAGKCTITRPDCLFADNVKVEEKCAVKECVIGANCQIKEGAKLTRCVLMDGVVVGKGCKITGSILGRRSEIGENSVLQDCEVEDNMRIEPKSKSRNLERIIVCNNS